MPRAIAITCEGVSKSFALTDTGSAWRLAFGAKAGLPMFDALRDITFDVPKGKFVGILGRNGAGKSTLLRVVGGVYAADAGKVTVNGALSGLYELGLVGNPQLTGRAYAERLLTMQGFKKRILPGMIADIHDFSELGDRFEDPVLTYSAGMTARLFFATSTAGSYDVYLLDEILSVGDLHFQAKCWRRMRDRIARGASGVLVTHDWSAIVQMCETAHILQDGRLVFSGPAHRAARIYLYGKAERDTLHEGVARLRARPQEPVSGQPGKDLLIRFEADILVDRPVSCVMVIERLHRGHGWENTLMSRTITEIGSFAGRYAVEAKVPSLPIDPGEYQVAINLVTPDPDRPGARLVLDSWSWLRGDGIQLEVAGPPDRGFCLPMQWDVHPALDEAA